MPCLVWFVIWRAKERFLICVQPELHNAFLGYAPGTDGPPTSALVDAIPEPRREKARAEVDVMLRSLAAVDAACAACAGADSLDAAAERLEAARNGLRECIALFYGESCIGSPCDRLPGGVRSGLSL